MFKTDMMPVKCDAKRHYVAGNTCFKTRSDQANHDFKMMYEGRLQRYCLLLSKVFTFNVSCGISLQQNLCFCTLFPVVFNFAFDF